jgi:hypothetical protein
LEFWHLLLHPPRTLAETICVLRIAPEVSMQSVPLTSSRAESRSECAFGTQHPLGSILALGKPDIDAPETGCG